MRATDGATAGLAMMLWFRVRKADYGAWVCGFLSPEIHTLCDDQRCPGNHGAVAADVPGQCRGNQVGRAGGQQGWTSAG